ncbi:hypothetical protein P280DRAFT_547367 [Massarina eburnea CBS 473.64]|uniref:AA1-like domain-containing protein n=1 Tax=Massarina eburnea CBS 473.64 TaxID=1395130 RepID=A0A6A6S8V1_9PLEO|nr:hypothetical protein P280DRAFT_547367 [Massarina eburnea CBS 473.64]
MSKNSILVSHIYAFKPTTMYLLPSLLSFALLTHAVALPSLHPRHDNCTNDCTTNPIYLLPQVRYSSIIIYSTPAHLAVSSATIEFNLLNSVDRSVNVSCVGYSSSQQSSGAFFAFPYSIPCTVPGTSGPITAANFSFTLWDRTLQINETWACDEDNYLGVGTKTLELVCETLRYQNPNWTTPGDIYSSESASCSPYSTYSEVNVTQLD